MSYKHLCGRDDKAKMTDDGMKGVGMQQVYLDKAIKV